MLRRLVIVAMFLVAAVGVAPMIPLVFGYSAATVDNDTAGTYYPTSSPAETEFVSCTPVSTAWDMGRNNTYTGRFFRCNNNWPANVNVAISFHINTTPAVTLTASGTVPAGAQNYCLLTNATVQTAQSGNVNPAATVTWKTTVDQSDLFVTSYTTGTVRVRNPGQGGPPTPCT